MNQVFGVDALLRMVSHFLFIYLAFWALQSVRLDQLFKKGTGHEGQIRFVYFFLAILLGYTASNFILEFISLSRNFFVSGF
ncbi:MAG: DUF1146 family protein [Lactobacillales bacterium]|jgi:uncharacterized integral membrane protein (TIGR02327 family)|nr:DUF1146 family protein [Lactobacillales bacterium]